MSSEELQLWWTGEANSMFVYYLTGALTIAFLTTVVITRSLRRKEPQVLELLHDVNERELLVSYIVMVSTEFSSGIGCPRFAKVFLQLCGENGDSQYFQLQSSTGGRELLQRGSTDMFLCKLPVSLGTPIAVKFVMSGIKHPLNWRVRTVQLFDFATRKKSNLSVSLTVTEVLDTRYGSHVVTHTSKYGWVYDSVCQYHQWWALYFNTVRFGAFTEIVHVMCVFTSLLSLLILTQLAYISLPRGSGLLELAPEEQQGDENEEERTFGIKVESFLIGSILASACSFILMLGVEMVLRSVKSKERKPGNAYYNVKNESRNIPVILRSNSLHCGGMNVAEDRDIGNDGAGCFLREVYLRDVPNIVQEMEKIPRRYNDSNIPTYVIHLLKFLENRGTCEIEERQQYSASENLTTRTSFDRNTSAYIAHAVFGNSRINNLDEVLYNLTRRPRCMTGNDEDFNDRTGRRAIYRPVNRNNMFDDNININASENITGANKSTMTVHLSDSEESSLLTCGGVRLYQFWESVQRDWSRNFIQALYTSIKHRREKIECEDVDYDSVDEALMDLCQAAVCRITTACTVQTHGQTLDLCDSVEMVQLVFHLAVETIVLSLHQIQSVLMNTDNVTLADLVLQSHTVMLAIEHAADAVLYFQDKGRHHQYLLSHLDVNQGRSSLLLVYMELCYSLVNKYSLMSWTHIKDITVTSGFNSDVEIAARLLEFVNENIKRESEERLAINRLCRAAETEGNEEVWTELHCVKHLLTDLLIKQQLLNVLRGKLDSVCSHKLRFDKKHDLLPKQPKSRIQAMMEKRKAKPATEVAGEIKHVTWEIKEEQEDGRVIILTPNTAALEKHSQDIGHYIDTLQIIYDRLKKKWCSEGVKTGQKTGIYLAQAVFHPHVATCDMEHAADVGHGRVKVDNFLHLKRVEKLLSQFYETTTHDMVNMLLNSVDNEFKIKHAHKHDGMLQHIFDNVLIKVDTLSQILQGDIDSVMYEVARIEPFMRTINTDLLKKSSHNLMKKSASLIHWSGLDIQLQNVTKSEMFELQNLLAEEGITDADIDVEHIVNMFGATGATGSQDITNNAVLDQQCVNTVDEKSSSQAACDERSSSQVACDEKSSSQAACDEREGTGENTDDNEATPFSHIIADMRSVKRILQSAVNAASLSDGSAQRQYIERCKKKLNYLHDVHIHNILDSYYMIEEGDDSTILTKAGLYQLEHDCMGEGRKPLPGCVKTLIMLFMLGVVVWSLVYVTLVGGQFSTTQLQEWVCYYLASVIEYGLIFEPFRAIIVGAFMRNMQQKMWK